MEQCWRRCRQSLSLSVLGLWYGSLPVKSLIGYIIYINHEEKKTHPCSLASGGWCKRVPVGVNTPSLVENAWFWRKRAAFGRKGGEWWWRRRSRRTRR